MRSDSSTCAGRPEDIRPATYFTSGEYATTSCSRARSEPDDLYFRHRSLSSIALTLVSSVAPWPFTPGDGCAHTQRAGALTLPECRPGSSIWRHAPAAPG